MNKNKVSDMAKDFGLTSKDILSVLSTYEDGSKKPSQVLSADEVNLIFEHLTQKHQVKIESIYAESAPQKKPEPKAAPAPAQNQPKANNAQNQPRNNNNNGGSRPQPQQGQQGKPAQPQQNTQPVQQQSKSTATQHPTTRVPEKKIVDTRKVTNVNLDKYDEKLQDMAERSGDRRDLERGSKEKFRNNRNRNNRQQPFSGKRKQEEAEKMRRLQLEIAKKTPLTVKIPDEISVGELASRMKKTGAEVVKCLIKNGVMASLSQMIDFDTASFVAEELGCKVEKEVVVTIEEKLIDDHEDSADELQPRAPVVVVMGHVDHGKTSLLDYIRNAHVASGEAGGITQHIGAYTVKVGDQPITFLDTPGHEDFAEDTYRTLTAVDSVIIVIDGAKGVESQTRKLMEVCRMRSTPVIVFINKLDRPSKEPFDLLDEVEKELRIRVRPLAFPISNGPTFRGVYNLYEKNLSLFTSDEKLTADAQTAEISDLASPELDSYIGAKFAEQLRSDVELVEGVYDEFDREAYLRGELAPVFFGSAVNNFGVRELLECFVRIAPSPRPAPTATRTVEPAEPKMTGFVFKIHANMDPNHRDRIAFMRICSGRFERDTEYFHVQSGRKMRLSQPQTMMAAEREIVDEAYAGDIIGVFDPGIFSIGDTITTPGKKFRFSGIPTFEPEHFMLVSPKDTMKRKQFVKGVEQIAQEGAIQIFKIPDSGFEDVVVGVVGTLQFDVFEYRMKNEYGVDLRMSGLPYEHLRLIRECPCDVKDLMLCSGSRVLEDFKGRKLIAFGGEWSVGFLTKHNEGLILDDWLSV